ncbi:AMP-activated protein kinase-like protein [Neolewinella xylanilytica]|uniref:Carboxypeptidase Q n=1 Tax=Neolewinella xylanilytica TaxID=1514080 RepID=A0A2S6I4U2_9BACT|nr:M20/M25/M40 family metallo-hydrolase [Neolewinella xylanilytica]PPK86129.1 AMP-activated protein kinase-like protein [Neolewinella xylanilytica]
MRGYPLAYSSGTNGQQEGEVLIVDQLQDLHNFPGTLDGKVVLVNGSYRPNRSLEGEVTRRLSVTDRLAITANPDPNDVQVGYHGRRSTTDVFDYREKRKKERQEILQFAANQGVIALVEASSAPYGVLHADGNTLLPSFDKVGDFKPLPSFVISNESFGRITRLVDMGLPVRLSLQSKVTYFEEPKFNVNLIAEIRGRDHSLGTEVITVGAHLDSWHAGTGAVDNASNCAVLVEAFRVLQVLNVQPKRTIRLMLWGGEEQVFAGSRRYVEDNIGSFTTGLAQPGNHDHSVYLNLDNGAGKVRGLYLMGNREIEPYLKAYLAPFPESNTLTIQYANQTDHELFDYHNVPAFQFIQDPLDYIPLVHHTDLDLYEYVPEKDQVYNAQLVAYLLIQLANEQEAMPRKRYNHPVASRTGNSRFFLPGYAGSERVYLTGSFNNWAMFSTPMYRVNGGWETYLDLDAGKHYYKFIVDENWTSEPTVPADELERDGKGHGGLSVIHVAREK